MQINQVFDSFFNRGFKGSRCKTLLNLAISRMKLLRNKREIQLKTARRELAELLKNGQEIRARIRVEHIIREQNIVEAYDNVELFCELIVARIPIIEAQRECPLDLQEAVASVIFAAPRSSDVPELLEVQNMFASKYGKEFVATATELRPDCRVNRLVIEKLSARAPSLQAKLNVMKEIAEENDVEWDPSNTENGIFKRPQDLLDGPNDFIGEPVTSPEEDESHFNPTEFINDKPSPQEEELAVPSQPNPLSSSPLEKPQFIPFLEVPRNEEEPSSNCFNSPPRESSLSPSSGVVEDTLVEKSHSTTGSEGSMNLQDILEAAEAAAESAEKAAQAARAAANLARLKISPKSADQKNSGVPQLNSEVVQERTFEMKSEPLFVEERGHMKDDFQFTCKSDEDTQEYQGEKIKGESGLYNLFDTAGNFQVGESVHDGQCEKEGGTISDIYRYENYEDEVEPSMKVESIFVEDSKFVPSVPTSGHYRFLGESKEANQPFYDPPGSAEPETTNPDQHPQRLPSLDDDPYYTYPNLFSKP